MRFTVASLAVALFASTVCADLSRQQVPLAKRHARNQRRVPAAASHIHQRSTAYELLEGLGEIFSGDGTYFTPGLNYCYGTTSDSEDMIVAASATLFSKWGGGTESSLCNKKVKITSGGKTVEAKITDECPADECTEGSLDMSPAVFKELAELSVGRLTDLKWAFMDGDDDSN